MSAQKGESYDCPSDQGSLDLDALDFYLSAPYFEQNRHESGTDNIPLDQVRLVEDESDCNQLMGILMNDEKLRRAHEFFTEEGYKVLFLRTDSFYFIRWKFKYEATPSGTIRIKTGPRKLFLVISSDFQTVWEFKV